MANKHPKEQELFSTLSQEKIALSSEVWYLIYSNIEDQISIIRLILALYLDRETPVPIDEIRKIFSHINEVSSVFRKLINPEIIKTEDKHFIKIKQENQTLHPIIKELFGHYIANDVQAMNFILGDHLDDKRSLDAAICQRILGYLQSMEEFLAKLKMNTETFEERIRNQLTLPIVYLQNMKPNLSDTDKIKIDKCLSSLHEIVNLLKNK